MRDTITIDGVALTTEEAWEVLAFWDAHCVGKMPERLAYRHRGSQFDWYVRDARANADLGPDLIEQLRDHCFPWREVRRDEVEPGEVFRDPAPGRAGDIIAGTGGQADREWEWFKDWGVESSRNHNSRSDDTVLVRRPREVGTRLRDVEPGTRLEAEDYEERDLEKLRVLPSHVAWRLLQGGTACACLDRETREIVVLAADTLVRIVEGES